MSAMRWALTGIAVVSLTLLAWGGLAAVTTGWVPRRARALILRPKLWGTGGLLSAVGLGAFLFLGPLSNMRHYYLALAGMGVNLVGAVLQSQARRPGRVPHPPTTTAV
ncbi:MULTISPECIES: hypothetical protein [Streptomyces]|uniref:Uncharacterized protein n=2 Tax=Streptomyces TaxID=1883 RepID=A0ABV9IFS5_9ACTN